MDPNATPILVKLDRPREVKWTMRAQARNASLPRPATFGGLQKSRNRLYVLCALIWAALVERDHEFIEPEDLAEHFKTAEQQLAGLKVITAMIDQAFPQKKSEPAPAPSPRGPSPAARSGPARG